MHFPTIEDFIGKTPLVRMQRMADLGSSTLLMKLEGNNPAGSVKDRPAISMISRAEQRGEIAPGDHLVEATSGNTGIALAMAAAIKGYHMTLIMPENASQERIDTMRAFGAKVVLVSQAAGMEGARDVAQAMQTKGEAKQLNQFANADNPLAHYTGTGPEIWRDTGGKLTHFVSAMGTTGTIVGVSRYLKEQNPAIQVVGIQPADDASIPGIRKWPAAYLPDIFTDKHIDQILEVSQQEAEQTTLRLAAEEGIFCGISSGGAVATAIKVARAVENALVVCVICDRGDRYLSTGLFGQDRHTD
ncbi:MAG: cysteine synthase B [Gammaproteobacteria bacterium]|nr:MAG: cysteine synthase B [Gammaproteobacteria bacterium]